MTQPVRTRRSAATAALVVLVTLVAVPTDVAAAGCAREVTPAGTWETTQRPTESGPLRDGAADVDGDTMLITDGLALWREDGGCGWREILRLPASPGTPLVVSSATDRILMLAIDPSDPERLAGVVASGRVVAEAFDRNVPFLPPNGEPGGTVATYVVRSHDGGASWTSHGPLAGPPSGLVFDHSGGTITVAAGGLPYRLAPDEQLPVPGAVAITDRTLPATDRSTEVPLLESLHADADGLHAVTSAAAVTSRDGAVTWSALDEPLGRFLTGPFPATTGAPRRLVGVQAYPDNPLVELWWGRDGLEAFTFGADRIAGSPDAVGWHPTEDRVLLATGDRGRPRNHPVVSLYDVDLRTGEITEIDDLRLSPILRITTRRDGSYVLAHADGMTSLTRDEEDDPSDAVRPPPVPAFDAPTFTHRVPAPPGPTTLRLEPSEVALPVGDRATVTATLHRPAAPTPLDLFLLIDTSDSFSPDIEAVAHELGDAIQSLVDGGVDVHVGLGQLGTRFDHRYRRVTDIGPIGDALTEGFGQLHTRGSREAHLVALSQVATGSGLDGRHGAAVQPGQQPSWRADSHRVVLMVTDTGFDDLDDPDAPSRDEVTAQLAAEDVRLIGMEVVRERGGDGTPGIFAAVEAADAAGTTVPTQARRDMEAVAAGTGSFAPPGGVDCRGNGTVEIAPGAPLVCTTTSYDIAGLRTTGEVLHRLLAAIEDRADLTLRSGGTQVRVVDPEDGVHRAVDLSDDQQRVWGLEVVCDGVDETVSDVVVSSARGVDIATAALPVRCGPVAAAAADPVTGPPAATPGGDPAPVDGEATGRLAVGPGTAPPVPATASGAAPTPASAAAPGTEAAGAPAAAPGTAGAGAPAAATDGATSPAAATAVGPDASSSVVGLGVSTGDATDPALGYVGATGGGDPLPALLVGSALVVTTIAGATERRARRRRPSLARAWTG